jgi:methylated-DNA-protein-cysteine methyltransferase related protein
MPLLTCGLLQLMNVNDEQYRERVYELVRKIPRGRVMTYGQIALVLGEGYTARTVGYVMHGADDGVPWQRVINSQGKISTGRLSIPVNLQQSMLEQEGVIFSEKGKCDLNKYQWWPKDFEPPKSDQVELFTKN